MALGRYEVGTAGELEAAIATQLQALQALRSALGAWHAAAVTPGVEPLVAAGALLHAQLTTEEDAVQRRLGELRLRQMLLVEERRN